MAHQDSRISQDIAAYLQAQEQKSLLRFITCGSVDDGKSTLIGRLLYESKMIFEDQLSALERDSKKMGTQGADIDFALLVDGLAAEREQGITIDVAYRFFSTDKRKFIVADTPGHEQYTRNMATGASTADLAIVLVDARQGILTQTRRHSFIVATLGVKHVVLAINKMDLIGYDSAAYETIVNEYQGFAKAIGLENVTAIPISALKGDNITDRSTQMDWFKGPSLMAHLETVNVTEERQAEPFRMPVQWVNRPNLDFRGFSGQIAGGSVKIGDKIRSLPSGAVSHVKSIVTMDGELPQAVVGQSVTVTLTDEIDTSRGDVLCAADNPASIADQFETTLLWMSDQAMLPGRTYLMKIGTRTVQATIAAPKYALNVNTLEQNAAKTLTLNEIGVCNLSLDQNIAFDSYQDNRSMGGFILIDRLSNATVGMGTLNFSLRRADNIHWQALDVNQQARAEQKGQKAVTLWFTGLSGSGKSTIANVLEKQLFAMGRHTYLLDGDNVRHGLNRDLGFTEADRVENIRRVSEVAKLMNDAGLIVLTSFISPFRAERQMARQLLGDDNFIEVWVDTPLEVAEQRDVKGLYAKARRGEIENFTGISSPYEAPKNAELHVNTMDKTAEEVAEQILDYLRENQYLNG